MVLSSKIEVAKDTFVFSNASGFKTLSDSLCAYLTGAPNSKLCNSSMLAKHGYLVVPVPSNGGQTKDCLARKLFSAKIVVDTFQNVGSIE